MTANPVLLQMKYARVVKAFSEKTGVSPEEALDLFYHSATYELVREGISDLHCRSEDYLAEMLVDEMKLGQEERDKCLAVLEQTGKPE